MQDSARLAATAEILRQCLSHDAPPAFISSTPLDKLLQRYFNTRRYLGSKDRAAIAQSVYGVVRHYTLLVWYVTYTDFSHAVDYPRLLALSERVLCHAMHPEAASRLAEEGRDAIGKLSAEEKRLLHHIANKTHLGASLCDAVRYAVPEWMLAELRSSLGNDWREELNALNEEAPVDLRTNSLLATREALQARLQTEGFHTSPTPHSGLGLRLNGRFPVFTSACFKEGWFEMQDEGSQLMTELITVKPGDKVIDFCAGAGGKTLALAARMRNKGRILAWDISQGRLEQLKIRLRRARVDNAQIQLIQDEWDQFIKRHKNSADAVIVDAPCSGSGTWRRNPDLKWRMNEENIINIHTLQKNILSSASRLPKVGGQLLYITCSLLQSENESQVDAFLHQNKNFRVVMPDKMWDKFSQQTRGGYSAVRLTPHKDGTDGFFAALLERVE